VKNIVYFRVFLNLFLFPWAPKRGAIQGDATEVWGGSCPKLPSLGSATGKHPLLAFFDIASTKIFAWCVSAGCGKYYKCYCV